MAAVVQTPPSLRTLRNHKSRALSAPLSCGAPLLLLLRKRERSIWLFPKHKQRPVNRRHVLNGDFEWIERLRMFKADNLITTVVYHARTEAQHKPFVAMPSPYESERHILADWLIGKDAPHRIHVRHRIHKAFRLNQPTNLPCGP